LRAAHANLAYHLTYVAWLSDHRNWLAGEELSFADLAAGAHLSCLDYLGEVDWARFPAAKSWYQRLKSRRAFQSLLADRIPGRPPASHYADLDF
jgi:glutathione S-transferase